MADHPFTSGLDDDDVSPLLPSQLLIVPKKKHGHGHGKKKGHKHGSKYVENNKKSSYDDTRIRYRSKKMMSSYMLNVFFFHLLFWMCRADRNRAVAI